MLGLQPAACGLRPATCDLRRESPAEPRPEHRPTGRCVGRRFWATALGVACCKEKAPGPRHDAGHTPASQATLHKGTRVLWPPAPPTWAPLTAGLCVPRAGAWTESGEPRSMLSAPWPRSRAGSGQAPRGERSTKPRAGRWPGGLLSHRGARRLPRSPVSCLPARVTLAVPWVRGPANRRGAFRVREHSRRGPPRWPLHFSVNRKPAAHRQRVLREPEGWRVDRRPADDSGGTEKAPSLANVSLNSTAHASKHVVLR